MSDLQTFIKKGVGVKDLRRYGCVGNMDVGVTDIRNYGIRRKSVGNTMSVSKINCRNYVPASFKVLAKIKRLGSAVTV